MNILQLLIESKLEYLLKAQGAKLEARAKADTHRDVAALDVIEQLAKADPTGNNHKYLQWIVNMYVKGQFKLEDVKRLQADVREFERVRSHLELKDINQYKTLKDLYAVLDPLEGKEVISNKEADRQAEAKFYESGQAKLLHRSEGLKLIELHSTEASTFFGRGTKWCTAGNENNMFDTYYAKGPLYVIIKNGEKFQFHFETAQFMDAQDTALDSDQLAELRAIPVIGDLFDLGESRLAEKFTKAIRSGEHSYALGSSIIEYLDYVEARVPVLEQALALSPEQGYTYATYTGHFSGGWPAYERGLVEAMATRQKGTAYEHALKYTVDVLGGERSQTIEDGMLQNFDPDDNAVTAPVTGYVINVLDERWPELEVLVLKEMGAWRLAVEYAGKIMQGPWPEFEQRFLNAFKKREAHEGWMANIVLKYALMVGYRKHEWDPILEHTSESFRAKYNNLPYEGERE